MLDSCNSDESLFEFFTKECTEEPDETMFESGSYLGIVRVGKALDNKLRATHELSEYGRRKPVGMLVIDDGVVGVAFQNMEEPGETKGIWGGDDEETAVLQMITTAFQEETGIA